MCGVGGAGGAGFGKSYRKGDEANMSGDGGRGGAGVGKSYRKGELI